MAYNHVAIMGRLTADPELRQTPNNVSICRFTVACERNYAVKGEERKSDFFDVVIWRGGAEFVSKYFTKGKMIIVDGELRNNNYKTKDGAMRYGTIIEAKTVLFGESKSKSEQKSETERTEATSESGYTENAISADELNEYHELLDNDTPF